MTTIIMLIRLAVGFWLGWIAVVLLYVLWSAQPLAFVLVVAMLLGAYVRHIRRNRAGKRHRIEAQWASRAEYYRQQRTTRALRHPDIVFEEESALWAKEMQS